MALNRCKMWSNGIKIAFFSKKSPKCPPPDPRLWCVWFTLVYSTRLPIQTFLLFNFWFIPKSWLSTNNTGHGFWSSIVQYLCLHKKSLFWKFLTTSMHVVCGLAPSPNGTPTPMVQKWHYFPVNNRFFSLNHSNGCYRVSKMPSECV